MLSWRARRRGPPSELETPTLIARWDSHYRAAVLAYFRRRGIEAAECEDLTQDVFLQVIRSGAADGVRQAEHYLFRAAANTLTDWRRRQAVRHRDGHESISDALVDSAPSAERVVIARDTLARLNDALSRLPLRTQQVFRLHHFEGMRYGEVALALGIAARTVEDHMARANVALLSAID
jgi:RNA polymerase sigma-70 factor (ECF subfamily)